MDRVKKSFHDTGVSLNIPEEKIDVAFNKVYQYIFEKPIITEFYCLMNKRRDQIQNAIKSHEIPSRQGKQLLNAHPQYVLSQLQLLNIDPDEYNKIVAAHCKVRSDKAAS
jgi:hypothetical protein